jgi:ABC-type bacteriocin/lantibiotic exporter with double-glycine peptidase domain
MRNFRLSCDLFKTYVKSPYEWFLSRHSADLSKTLLSEVHQVISSAVMPFLSLITGSVTAFFMVVLLLIADPLLAFVVSISLGGGYAIIYAVSRRYLTRIGNERIEANRQRFRASSEALTGIKDVKVLGLEKAFINRFEQASKVFAMRQAASELIGEIPRYALQALAFTIVLVIVWYQLAIHENVSQGLPVIALYALAGFRLLPALQKVYKSASRLRYAGPALRAVHADLTIPTEQTRDTRQQEQDRVHLKRRLEIAGLSYRYPGASALALQEVSFSIPAHTVVGLVGRTGAGKTTLVDAILGLLQPETGNLCVDGVTISDANRRAWQKTVGYVPQHIFLADDSIAANIAFGVPPSEIDSTEVERAARVANLHDFVIEELEHGYATLIGERGIRLSGGQRQRVGIARALYRDPDLLIMDEGTSALDNITERAVMEAVNNLSRAKTIILIAHRLTTVRSCDQILLLQQGQLMATGTFEELVIASDGFREMAIG